jgi:N-acetylglucosaminyl-diphospho-decaprenol L-rhamnosyltransferase
MSAPLLSIVVFTRDDAGHLERCLASLAAAPPSARFEVVVVDNASSDRTAEVVAAAAARLPLQELALTEETSFSRGNNLGLERCSGELVLFLNPDTLPTGPTIDRCLAVLRGDPRIGLVGPRLVYPDGRPQPGGWHLPTPRQLLREHLGRAAREVEASPSGLTPVGWLMGCFLMGPRALLGRLGGFDEDFWFAGTDLELCARVASAGCGVVRVEHVELVHVGHEGWGLERRRGSHEALVRWLDRDHGSSSAELVAAAARFVERWRR